jgi:hypothetical protein
MLLPTAARRHSAVATTPQFCEIASSNINLVGRCLVFMLTSLYVVTFIDRWLTDAGPRPPLVLRLVHLAIARLLCDPGILGR